MEPCTAARLDLQLVNTIVIGVSALLGVWLAHRRLLADRDRFKVKQEVHEILETVQNGDTRGSGK